jgi:dephospho-CoA kinase
MLTIGLTGGIGSGKSTVAKFFAAFKVPVIDADAVVHQLLQPNTTTFKKIRTHFGNSVIKKNGALDRKKIREIIFTQPKEKTWLEKLLHPAVRKIMLRKAKKLKYPYCILVIPLLFEAKMEKYFDRIFVVDALKQTRINRAMGRDYTKMANIKAIIASQIPSKQQVRLANDVIKNNGSLRSLKQAVRYLHAFYLSLT